MNCKKIVIYREILAMMTRKDNLMAIYHHQSHDHIGAEFDEAGCGGMREEFENGPVGPSGGLDGFGMEWIRNVAGSFPAPLRRARSCCPT